MKLDSKSLLLALGVLVVAFLVWSQNLVDNSALILLAALALLAVALIGQTHSESEKEHEMSEWDKEDFGQHPESHEEEAHGGPAGH